MPDAEEILQFWFETLAPEDHFMGGERVDDMIRSRYHDLWIQAAGGGFAVWQERPDTALALTIVLDQFPRNMFRGSGQSFHSDALAREISGHAIEARFDMRHPERRRLFFYMPFMHSERLRDQDRCVDLIAGRVRQTGAQNLLHARAHRWIIEKFHRFPFRNAALGRQNTLQEDEWLSAGGYMKTVEQIEADDNS